MRTNFLCSAAVLLFSAGLAQADCITSRFRFHPAQNDTVPARSVTDTGKCEMIFRAGARLAFTDASITAQASHGKLTQPSKLNFIYVAQPGYKGIDTYSVKVCGSGPAGQGCSTINYEINVK